MIIMKFGGSSVANGERMERIAQLVRKFIEHRPILVLSAMDKTTNNLIALGNEAVNRTHDSAEIKQFHRTQADYLKIDPAPLEPLFAEMDQLLLAISMIRELTPRTLDYLVSFGERFSVRMFAGYLNRLAIPAKFHDAWDLGFTTDSHFGGAEVLEESHDKINLSLREAREDYPFVPVVTGFIAKDRSGQVTTLGRGGSDVTAATLGAALEVEEVQVWKDVDGIMTCDPRLVPEAQPIPHVTFEAASELAFFGAKVLHPRTILPAIKKNIRVRVKNSYKPDHPGTLISGEATPVSNPVIAMTLKRHVTLVDIVSTRMLGQSGFLAEVFKIFSDLQLSVDMIATSEVSISLTLDQGQDNHLPALEKEIVRFARVNIDRDKALISIIGDVKRSNHILARGIGILDAMGSTPEMISHGASKVNIGLVVEDGIAVEAVTRLHREFFPTG